MAKGNLHTLDFTRIKDVTRSNARKLLTDSETGLPNGLAQELSIPSTSTMSGAALSSSTKSAAGKTVGAGAGAGGGKGGRLMTPEEKKRVVEALMRASTTEEVRKLERMLAEGLVPEEGINGA